MRTRVRPSYVLLVALLAAAPAAAQVATSTGEKVDYDAIYKIKDEGFQRSQVMDTASWLTDVYGPRLTGSPSFKAAADWAVKKLTEWGAANARTEAWGTFGRGWVNERFSATVVSGAQPWVLTGTPKAWTPGIEGTVTADVVFAPMENEADLEKWKGKLKGKIVLPLPTREVKAHFEPQASRMTDADLEKLLKFEPTAAPRRNYNMASVSFMVKRLEFLQAEGVLAVFEPGRGDGGTIFVQQGGAYNPKGQQGFMRLPAVVPPQVVIPVEHYGRLVRTLERKMPVSVELTIRNTMTEDQEGMNVFAELPGTDKADEVVMLGAHFDGWHGGTGATDNAAGSAVMLEAIRILKASGVKLRRTVRLGLWGGEEQGLIGSREYVKATFADRATMQLKPAHAQDRGLLQRRQRHRRHPRRVPAGQRGGRADVHGMDAAVREPRDDDVVDPEHGRHRPPVVRRGRPPRLPVHPGRDRVRHAHPPLQHGRVGTAPGGRHDEERGDRRLVRLSRGQPRPDAAAQAAAEAAAAADAAGDPGASDDAELARHHGLQPPAFNCHYADARSGAWIAEVLSCDRSELALGPLRPTVRFPRRAP